MLNLKRFGFTLMEVMVSMAILAIAVTTLLVIRNDAIKEASRAKEARRLKMLLEQKMGEIVVGLEKKTSGYFADEGYQNYIWQADIKIVSLKSQPDALKKEVQSINLKKITLTIRDKEIESSKGQTIETYIFEENPENAPDDTQKPSTDSQTTSDSKF